MYVYARNAARTHILSRRRKIKESRMKISYNDASQLTCIFIYNDILTYICLCYIYICICFTINVYMYAYN